MPVESENCRCMCCVVCVGFCVGAITVRLSMSRAHVSSIEQQCSSVPFQPPKKFFLSFYQKKILHLLFSFPFLEAPPPTIFKIDDTDNNKKGPNYFFSASKRRRKPAVAKILK